MMNFVDWGKRSPHYLDHVRLLFTSVNATGLTNANASWKGSSTLLGPKTLHGASTEVHVGITMTELRDVQWQSRGEKSQSDSSSPVGDTPQEF